MALPSTAKTQIASDPKLRILCLHGYLQSSEIFRNRIGSARKALKKHADFFFADGPHLVDTSEAEAATNSGAAHGRSWWTWEDENATRPSEAATYTGWDASEQAIHDALTAHAPIDFLLGFSQGAAAAALFMASTDQHTLNKLDLKGAILVSGFCPRDESWAAKLTANPVRLPTLFVAGEKDELVSLERSQRLWETWASQEWVSVYRHGGGHMVPTCSGEFKAQLLAFLLTTAGRIGESNDTIAEGTGGRSDMFKSL